MGIFKSTKEENGGPYSRENDPNRNEPRKIPSSKTWLIFIGILILNYLVVNFFFPDKEEAITIPYTLFKEEVTKGNVRSIYSKGELISGKFTTEVSYTAAASPDGKVPEPEKILEFKTVVPAFADQGLEALLAGHQVEILADPVLDESNSIWSLLASFGPALLIIAFYIWLFRKAQARGGFGGLMGMGESNAKIFDVRTEERVTFDDVAGIDEAENELVEIVDFLKNPEKYTRLGGTAPKGVLLVGAPGTGKTLLARAVAGESGVPFFSMSASEFVEMIVGVGAARVRDLFKLARENAPSIIFIDELDSIGRSRGQYIVGGASEQEQTLNQILTEMDGFSSKEGVIVLAATNQPDILDKALLRAGRFDRRIVINPPDKTGRIAILKVHTRKVPLDKKFSFEEIAAITPGFTGADLKNLVNEAALQAAHENAEKVTTEHFMNALEKIVLGPERPILLSKEDRERIAYHESGHAILGLLVPGAEPVNRVTIVPRGQALGVTYQRPDRDKYNYEEEYLRARIIGILGGRSAEEVVYGTKTTGAENDIEQATEIAWGMVTRWGMSDELGLVQLGPTQNEYLGVSYGDLPYTYIEETAKKIDAEIVRIINECHDEAIRLLKLHRKKLDALANALLDKETLEEKEILEVTGLPPAPDLEIKKH
ncbi:ATP-dependent metallopeptidase FtsH/Yme1/Tma family protein [Algoriphagus lacus]|uniref:ATP-dependent zinc metalloprotease FtsH n=1 Tax=Algoriphagus lacus TaxID=2056311 RepID=A0A418PVW6_9BACT|nr:ATP-dependent zinc metalloprotease FtsH [Algoriphagus lacus]RIW18215.1 ATP-dependent metallopeptidase FtsH/Yme1/Tma family protein [Algoriphagus lacus]